MISVLSRHLRSVVHTLLLILLCLPLTVLGQEVGISGTYTGDGELTRSITGLGFTPTLVMIKSESATYCYLKTAEMPEGYSIKPADNKGLETRRIESLDADGFTVGDNNDVNESGTVYYWSAMATQPGLIQTGTYTGDGTATRLVTLTDLEPAAVMVLPAGNYYSVWRQQEMPFQISGSLNGFQVLSGITALTGGGFYVGDNDRVNADGVEFYYLALASEPGILETGSYTGDGQYGRDIADLGLSPGFLMISNTSYHPPVFRTRSVEGDASLYFNNGSIDGGLVTSIQDNSFTVGNSNPVNLSGVPYYWLAMANPETQTDLQLQLTSDQTTPPEDSEIVLTVRVDNAGTHDAGEVAVSTTLPAGLVYQTHSASQGSFDSDLGLWDVTDITAGAFATLDITAIVATGSGGSTFEPSALISAMANDDTDTTNNSASMLLTIPAPAGADLALSLAVDQTSADEGEDLTYLLTVTNHGPEATSALTISTVVPAALDLQDNTPQQGTFDTGAGSWDVGPLAAGTSTQLEIVARPTVGTSGQAITVSAALDTVTPADPNADNDSAQVAINVNTVDLGVFLLSSDATPSEGQTVSLTAAVSNYGPGPATGTSLDLDLVAGLTYQSDSPEVGSFDPGTGIWDVGNLAPGSSTQLTVVVLVDAGTTGTTLTPTLAISALDQVDPIGANNTATVDHLILAPDEIDLDLNQTLDKSAPGVGDLITFTLVLDNLSESTATGVEVTSLLPEQVSFQNAFPSQGLFDQASGVWTVGELAADRQALLYLQALVLPAAIGTPVIHTSSVSAADQSDPSAGNNTASTTFTVPTSDLALDMVADDNAPPVGSTVQLTATLTNNGPGLATGTSVNVVLPPGLSLVSATPEPGIFDLGTGTWTPGSLNPSLSSTLVLEATVASAAAGRSLECQVGVSASDQADTQPANNAATTTLAIPGADLELQLASDQTVAFAGDTVTLTLDLTNQGPDAASGIAIDFTDPGHCTLISAVAGQGTYDPESRIWQVGSLAAATSTDLILVVQVEDVSAETTVTATAAIAATSPADPVGDNDSATTVITIPVGDGSGTVIFPVVGTSRTVLPGAAQGQTVLEFAVVNNTAAADTLRAFTLTNLTPGAGTAQQMDAEWQPLAATAAATTTGSLMPGAATMASGLAAFTDLNWAVAPGDTLRVTVLGAPTLQCRDGARLAAGLADADHLEYSSAYRLSGSWPLTSGHLLEVNGFVAAQAQVVDQPSALLAVGSQCNPVLSVNLPANGFLPDTLSALAVTNFGSALPGEDIGGLEFWVDTEPLGFDESQDLLLGTASYSGDRWQLTGLRHPVPATGLRIVACVDIAESGQPDRDIRLGLPVSNGHAVEMTSANDGPVDAALESGASFGISATDRIILTSEWYPGGTTLPDARELTLLKFSATNTYTVDKTLYGLTIVNNSVIAGASAAQRDTVFRQLTLVHDANGNGQLDDLTADPRLASGIFRDGKLTFTGLDLDLPAGAGTRLLVLADLDPALIPDGSFLEIEIPGASSLNTGGANLVAPWPLASQSPWTVDGMIARQVQLQDIPAPTLGPDEGPVLALDLLIPPNGIFADELTGLTLRNQGTALGADLQVANLYKDDGDGLFDPDSDTLLCPLTINGNTWSSTVLASPIPGDGLRLFTGLVVASAPSDSVTVQLGVPQGGITVSSGNDGPVDQALAGLQTLTITTSPLRTSLEFASAATDTGQAGQVIMTVRNAGSEVVTDITPFIDFLEGGELLELDAPSPAQITSLDPGQVVNVTWPYTSRQTGQVTLEGNSAGFVNTDQVRRSILTRTSAHRIYLPVPGLELYPTANLPFSVNQGTRNLSPMTLTFVNPGGDDVADAHLTGLQLRFRDGPDGPGIVPADLVERLTLAEGTDLYLTTDDLPTSGDTVDLSFTRPVIVTGSEPVSLGLYLNLNLGATAQSFQIVLEQADWMTASDAVNGAQVGVTLGQGSFPFSTSQATLVAPATGLNVAVTDQGPATGVPGQENVALMALQLDQNLGDSTSSSVEVGRLAFQFRNAAGAPLTDASAYFERLILRSAYQVHFAGLPTVQDDSLLVLTLEAPLSVAGTAQLPLTLAADLAAQIPLGAVTPLVGPVTLFDARDGNMNSQVPVNLTTAAAGPALTVLNPAAAMLVAGQGVLPSPVSIGTRDVLALELQFSHPGEQSSTPVFLDSLTLGFLDQARQPLTLSRFIDQVTLQSDDQTVGVAVDPTDASGAVTIALGGLTLEPGQILPLSVLLDLKPDSPVEGLEVIVDEGALHASDAVTGAPIPLVPAEGTLLPLSSGPTVLTTPADVVHVAGTSLMPPLLAPRAEPYDVLAVTLTNPAPAGGGSLQLYSLSLTGSAAKADNPALGAMLAAASLRVGTEVVATLAEIPSEATSLVLEPSSDVVLAAGQTLEVVVEVTVAENASPGSLSLTLAGDGLVLGPPGGQGAAVQVIPAAGQTFPFDTEVGNVGAAGLEESYANFPNPFAAGREATTFAFSLPEDARVNLRILTPHGRLVRNLINDESRTAGFYQDDLWDGTNGNGRPVNNGVYLAEITARFIDGTTQRILRKVAVVR